MSASSYGASVSRDGTSVYCYGASVCRDGASVCCYGASLSRDGTNVSRDGGKGTSAQVGVLHQLETLLVTKLAGEEHWQGRGS